MNRTELIMLLLNIPLLGRERIKNILTNFKPGTDLWEVIGKLYPFLSIGSSDLKRAREKVCRQLDRACEQGIRIISCRDSFYPRKLLSIGSFPPLLYLKGDRTVLNHHSRAALIGSRQSGKHILNLIEPVGDLLLSGGYTVVSGLALGCDTKAHWTALKTSGSTVAVMPCGADIVYPRENTFLYYQILENRGLILSEYAPGVPPAPYRFVERDRLQSGLSDIVVLMDSSLRGGSMHTAYAAIRQKRPLFVYRQESSGEDNSGNRFLLENEKVYPFTTPGEFALLLKKMPAIIRDCNRESDQLIFPYV